jgi:hypothetical protein
LILKYDEQMKDDKEISEMKEVKDTFSLWLKNLTSYEKQVIENMSDLQSEVGIN